MKKRITLPWAIAIVALLVLGFYGMNASLHSHNADASSTPLMGFQFAGGGPGCTTNVGTARYVTDVQATSSWISDSNDYDPDCVKFFMGNNDSFPKDTDIRIGVQARDINTPCGLFWLFKCGDGGGTVVYGPWASDGGGWSGWASDADQWDPDQWRYVISTRPWYGHTVSDLKLGLQLDDSSQYAGGCPGLTDQYSNIYYAASSSAAGGWVNWITDADHGDGNRFNCMRLNISTVSSLNSPTAAFTGTTTAPIGTSVNVPWDVEYINTGTGCTLSNNITSDTTSIKANGAGSVTSIAITQPTTYSLHCNGLKAGTTVDATPALTIYPYAGAQPTISLTMSPTSLAAGSTSLATIAVENTSFSTTSCTLTGYAVDSSGITTGTVVDATDPTFLVPPESAVLSTAPTQTDTYYLTVQNSGSFTVPANWNSGNNSIEVIGAGGAGQKPYNGGGGGGAYSKITNLALTPSASITYSVGTGGVTSTAGGDTWFNRTAGSAGTCADTSSVCAKGGSPGAASAGGSGGQASGGIANGPGSIKNSGGNGGGTATTGGGGGGAAGPHGNGASGGSGSGTNNGGDGGGGADGGTAGAALAGGSNNGSAGGSGYVGAGGAGGTSNGDGADVTGGNGGGGGGSADGSNGGGGGEGGRNMTFCANEGGTCVVTGTKAIIFIADNNSQNRSFVQQFTNTTVSCSTGTFGDPQSGAAKTCFITDTASLSGGGGGAGGARSNSNRTAGAGGLYGGGNGAAGGGLGGSIGAPGLIIIKNTYVASAAPIYLTTQTSWTVPSDWNSSNNTIEVIGAGGNGSNGGGGGGGAYSKISNVSLSPSSSVTVSIGQGSGADTYFNGSTCATASACAKGGSAGAGANGTAGGGQAASGLPAGAPCTVGALNMRCSGGSGGSTAGNGSHGGGGGGGAGGPNGAGKDGGSELGGNNEGGGGGGNSGGHNGNGPTSCGFPPGNCGGSGGNGGPGQGGGGGGGNCGGGGGGGIGAGGGGGDDCAQPNFAQNGASGGAGTDIDGTVGGGGGGGGAGGSGRSNNGGNGANYGGGGGGRSSAGGTAGTGAAGIIVITYTPGNTLATNTGAHTSNHTVNVTTDFQVMCTDGITNTPSSKVRVTLGACMLDGVPIANNGSGNFYSAITPPAGQTCSQIQGARGCSAGVLTGGTSYQYASCTDQGSVTITANGISPQTSVRKGAAVAITWDAGTINPDNPPQCTVTGSDGFNAVNTDGTTDTSGTKSATVTKKTVYTARCTLGSSVKQASVTVNILPTVIEI